MRKLLLLSLLCLVLLPVASEAAPISVDCPNTADPTDREFTLTTDPVGATCLTTGNDANELNANVHDVILNAGWTYIDKDNHDDPLSPDPDNGFIVLGLGADSGSFSIDPTWWDTFDELVIGFVVGGGPVDPKWAVFLLPEGETTGLWANAPTRGGGLSHGVLYGRGEGTGITEVPEPATLLLLGSGLTLAARRRRAKR